MTEHRDDKYYLSRGKHEDPTHGRCAMEWVAYLAGEPHTDRPKCVDITLRIFLAALNDGLGDEDRQRLRPYLARCIGTADDGHIHVRRRLMGKSWYNLMGFDKYYWPTLFSIVDNVAARLATHDRVDEALDLLDQMLPKEMIQMPIVEDADAVCAVPSTNYGSNGA
jgi:hypothetical protein